LQGAVNRAALIKAWAAVRGKPSWNKGKKYALPALRGKPPWNKGLETPAAIRQKQSAARIAGIAKGSCPIKRGRACSSYKHGLSSHPLIDSFRNMMGRCYNPEHGDYRNYGGSGIDVYAPWRDDKAAFIFGVLALLGDRPVGYSLDRRNPHEGYYPWNVRWADAKTQKLNSRDRVSNFFSLEGEH
jgi:hypothetical protein